MSKEIEYTYGVFRRDKPKQPGFSHELISPDFWFIQDQCDIDSLDALAYPGVDTLYKAMHRHAALTPDEGWLGTLVGDSYQWLSWKECAEISENIGHGLRELKLIPSVHAEGKNWKFMGIMSKNRKEWNLLHLGNMHQGVTSVAFYDTLGEQSQLTMVQQTHLSTIAVSADLIEKIAKLKI